MGASEWIASLEDRYRSTRPAGARRTDARSTGGRGHRRNRCRRCRSFTFSTLSTTATDPAATRRPWDPTMASTGTSNAGPPSTSTHPAPGYHASGYLQSHPREHGSLDRHAVDVTLEVGESWLRGYGARSRTGLDHDPARLEPDRSAPGPHKTVPGGRSVRSPLLGPTRSFVRMHSNSDSGLSACPARDVSRIGPATDCETLRNVGLRWGETAGQRLSRLNLPGSGERRIKLIIRCSGCAALDGQPWCRSGSRLPLLGRCGLAAVTSFTVGDVVYAIWSRGHEPAAQSHSQPVWIL